MFLRKGPLTSAAVRKLEISGGEANIDYKACGHRNAIVLFTADTEHLTKGKRHRIKLLTRVRPRDRFIAVAVNNELHDVAVVNGTAWISPEDSGEIILNITPRVDIDLGSLDYIVKLFVEGLV